MSKLTVAEYAELKCITVQAVYKRINKLNTIEEERNGRKITLIIIEDEEEKANIKPNSTYNSTSTSSTSTTDNISNSTYNSTSTSSTSTTDNKPSSTDNSTSDIIEVLKIQLQEKDKQIERLQDTVSEKDKQLKEQFDKFAELLYRQQQLEAITQHKLIEDSGVNDNIVDEEKQENKKGFFSRLFKRKKGGE